MCCVCMVIRFFKKKCTNTIEKNFQHIYWLYRHRLREEKKKEEKIGLFKKKLYYIKKYYSVY